MSIPQTATIPPNVGIRLTSSRLRIPFEKNQGMSCKVAKNLPKSSPTDMDVLYLIMLHIDGNVEKKFQPSIFYRSRENHVFSKTFQTDGHT